MDLLNLLEQLTAASGVSGIVAADPIADSKLSKTPPFHISANAFRALTGILSRGH